MKLQKIIFMFLKEIQIYILIIKDNSQKIKSEILFNKIKIKLLIKEKKILKNIKITKEKEIILSQLKMMIMELLKIKIILNYLKENL